MDPCLLPLAAPFRATTCRKTFASNKNVVDSNSKREYKSAHCDNVTTSIMTGENGAKPEAEKKRRPTIVDIANRAGVAPMTVSRVINESGYVSREAREKVERAVKELNYHPKRLARSVERESTHIVDQLLPDI